MGKQVIPWGKHSSGLAAKLCNNYLSGIIAIASSEALNMGIRAGLDPHVLSDILQRGRLKMLSVIGITLSWGRC